MSERTKSARDWLFMYIYNIKVRQHKPIQFTTPETLSQCQHPFYQNRKKS